MIPVTREHDGILVVRDDLFPGGTKARFIPRLFDGADEVVYASPCQGGAQYALAFVAQQLGKRATIFVARRGKPHARQFEAKRLGAKVVLVEPGYLNVVQARARDYATAAGARLAPFGMDLPGAIDVISDAALSLKLAPAHVYCAAGSGTLCRSLIKAWPKAQHHAIAVGRDIPPDKVGHCDLYRYHRPFEATGKPTPFPSDPHYEAKAWEVAKARYHPSSCLVVFWNVTGPAQEASP